MKLNYKSLTVLGAVTLALGLATYTLKAAFLDF